MVVDDAGNGRAAVEVDDLGAVGGAEAAAACRGDAVADDMHGLDDRAAGIHRVDDAAGQQHVIDGRAVGLGVRSACRGGGERKK